jgi:hypothetical protein
MCNIHIALIIYRWVIKKIELNLCIGTRLIWIVSYNLVETNIAKNYTIYTAILGGRWYTFYHSDF